jgi:hypothetical protein
MALVCVAMRFFYYLKKEVMLRITGFLDFAHRPVL